MTYEYASQNFKYHEMVQVLITPCIGTEIDWTIGRLSCHTLFPLSRVIASFLAEHTIPWNDIRKVLGTYLQFHLIRTWYYIHMYPLVSNPYGSTKQEMFIMQ